MDVEFHKSVTQPASLPKAAAVMTGSKSIKKLNGETSDMVDLQF
jgi:hypothetical protein